MLPVTSVFPTTSNLELGLVVPIPKLPLFVTTALVSPPTVISISPLPLFPSVSPDMSASDSRIKSSEFSEPLEACKASGATCLRPLGNSIPAPVSLIFKSPPIVIVPEVLTLN